MTPDHIIDFAIRLGAYAGMDSLLPADRDVWLISEAEVYCDMEGIDSFLDQYDADTVRLTAQAFDAIGAEQIATALKNVHGALPSRPAELLNLAGDLISLRSGYSYENIREYVSAAYPSGHPCARAWIKPDVNQIIAELKETDVRNAYILAFKGMIYSSYTENALVLIEKTNSQWVLVNLYRHLITFEGNYKPWSVSGIMDDLSYEGWREYPSLPAQTEVEEFIHVSRWSYQVMAERGCFVHGEIYLDTWDAVLGFTPKDRFPKPAQS
ncbi:MAG TPA: hypothetical protein VGH19_13330 [Verrucomicrobiae bacterium]